VVVTDWVVTVKFADPEVPVIVTDAGTGAIAELELVSVMTSPPWAATPLRVTVPVDVAVPPTNVDGFSVID
jgi:hypothetical protein